MKSVKLTTFNRGALQAALAFSVALGSVGFVGNACAAIASSTATSTVIIPIAIVANGVLSFGKFAPGAGGSVTISNSGARTGSGVILSSTGSTQTAARFDVTGEASTTYAITHGGVTQLTGISGAALTIPSTMALAKTSDLTGADVTSNNVSAGTLSAGGAQSVFVGGTLTVNGAQPAGVYTGSVSVTVEYN